MTEFFEFKHNGRLWNVHQRWLKTTKVYAVHIRRDGEHIDRALSSKPITSEDDARKIVEAYDPKEI